MINTSWMCINEDQTWFLSSLSIVFTISFTSYCTYKYIYVIELKNTNICHIRGGLSRIDVLTLPRQTLVRPTGYERCDLCEEVYYWSYGDWWLLPAVLSNLDDTKVIKT